MKYYKIFLKSGNSITVRAEGIEYDIESDMPKFFNLQTNIHFIDWECVEAIITLLE